MRIPLLGAVLGALIAIGTGMPAVAQAPEDTVAAIRARGHLVCGISANSPGFAVQTSRDTWAGFEVDYCRAIASVVLGDANKVKLVPVSTAERLAVLEQGGIDVLSRNTTWTLEREVGGHVEFAAVTYYDGQSFMLRADRGIRRIQQMDGLKVCVETSTTTEQNVADHARAMRLRLTLVQIPDLATAQAAFLAGFCDALTSDQSVLAGIRKAQGSRADQFVLLGEIISKEPLSLVVRRGDWRFFNIVRWTHLAMVAAEELNMDSGAVRDLRSRSEPELALASLEVRRLLGRVGSSGRMLGLDADWAARLVLQVGNYREVWERNIAPLGIRRGLNLLWSQGGLQYAPADALTGDRLPPAVAAALRRWGLAPDGALLETPSSWILPVCGEGAPAVLKVARTADERRGYGLMQWWAGQGAAAVLASAPGVLLLERATGRRDLAAMARAGQDDEATRILCRTAGRLHQARPGSVPELHPLPAWFQPLFDMAGRDSSLARAAAAASRLLAEPRSIGPLHGDLHHGNVLDFGARGWLAIDPHGLLGERCFDYANIFTNPDLDDPAWPVATLPGRLEARLAIVAATAPVEPGRMLQWIVAWTGLSAAWFIGDGNDEGAAIDLTINRAACGLIDV